MLGASGGIGSQISLKLGLQGFRVVGLGTNEEKLKRVKKEIRDIKGDFNYFTVDLNDKNQIKLVIREVFEKFNGVNIIVNSVGKYRMGLFLDMPFDTYEDLININLKAIVNFYYNFLNEYKKHIKESNKVTKLEQIIDILALIPIIIYGGNAVAAASKSGLMTFSLDLAKEIEWLKNSDDLRVKENAKFFGSIRLSRIYPENVDTTIYKESDKDNPIWPIESFHTFSPAIVANEVLNLIMDKEYINFNDVTIKIVGKDVIAGLHTLNENGIPDFSNSKKTFKRGEIVNTFTIEVDGYRKVLAAKDFKKGELILQATGEVINHQTEHSYQIGWDKHLEAGPPTRFINHSCDPNAGIKTEKQTGFPNIVAFRDIKKGEEITIDYAMSEFKHYPRDDPGLEFDLTCKCGTRICRGKLGYYSELPEELKKKYKGFISDYLSTSESRN